MKSENKLKVLSFAGSGRSGSTILGNVLGQIDGFVHVGELCYAWNRGFQQDTLCGCGAAFRNCEFWGAIQNHPEVANLQTAELEQVPRRLNRHLPWLMWAPHAVLRRNRRVAYYLEALAKLYGAIGEASQCRVLIDSSKVPSHSYLLSLLPEIDLYYIHLVRDPRAVAYSWQRKLMRLDHSREKPVSMARASVGKSAIKWDLANLTAERLRQRYRSRVLYYRYEQFVRSPEDAIAEIVSFVREEATELSFLKGDEVTLQPTHTVWGNYNRLQTGTVKLRIDDEWRSAMDTSDRALVTALTWPLLMKYRLGVEKAAVAHGT